MLGFGVPVNTICLAGSEWFVTRMLTGINKLTICWSLYNTALYSQEILLSNVVTIDFCLNPEIFKEEKNISKVNNSEAESTKRATRTQKNLQHNFGCHNKFFHLWKTSKKVFTPSPPSPPPHPPTTTSSSGLKLLTKTGTVVDRGVSKISSDLQKPSLLHIWQ